MRFDPIFKEEKRRGVGGVRAVLTFCLRLGPEFPFSLQDVMPAGVGVYFGEFQRRGPQGGIAARV